METIRSKDGTAIAFYRSGTGSPLLLVHGAVSDHSRWSPVLPPLERAFTVYALDRRGRGGSGDMEPYAIEREFEDIAAVIDSIAGPVDVLAHSFGAFCALEAARLTPHVGRLILYEPPPSGVKGTLPPATAARLEAHRQANNREALVTTFLREVAQIPPPEIEQLRSLPAWQGRIAAAHTILREITALEGLPPFNPQRYQELTMPLLLLLGGDSPDLYRDALAAIQAALPNSRLALLPGQKHVAMNTAPALFLSEVLAFLTPSPS